MCLYVHGCLSLYICKLAGRGQSIDEYRYSLELAVAIKFLPTVKRQIYTPLLDDNFSYFLLLTITFFCLFY